jgi:hypothetical protein
VTLCSKSGTFLQDLKKVYIFIILRTDSVGDGALDVPCSMLILLSFYQGKYYYMPTLNHPASRDVEGAVPYGVCATYQNTQHVQHILTQNSKINFIYINFHLRVILIKIIHFSPEACSFTDILQNHTRTLFCLDIYFVKLLDFCYKI